MLAGGVVMYLFAPAILEVFSSWSLVAELRLRWFVAIGLAQVMVFLSSMALQRVALRTKKWGPVITSQLAGNAAGRIVPGGAAIAVAVQVKLLRHTGVDPANVPIGLAAAGVLQFGAILALPVVALPGIILNDAAPSGVLAITVSAVALFIALALAVVTGFVTDRPLRWLGGAVDLVRSWAPFVASAESPTATRLLVARNELRTDFGPHLPVAILFAISRALFDYLSLGLALRAFGVGASPALLLAVFSGATLLAMIPLTPGGLGFVETGLTGGLVVLGVASGTAVSVALLYRLFSFWLPIPVGLLAGVVHRMRYPPDTR